VLLERLPQRAMLRAEHEDEAFRLHVDSQRMRDDPADE